MIHKDIEMALALAMYMVEGTIGRRQAEERLVEERTARGRWPRASTARDREL